MSTGHELPAAADFPVGVTTDGPAATAALGERVAGLLRGGEILLLHGGLGAGKTCFVQGLCRGLGVTGEVVSPTFTLVNTYEGRLRVHHLDFFRLESTADLADIGVHDLLDEIADGGAVLVVEWPGPLLGVLGSWPRIELLASPLASIEGREWRLRGRPELPGPWRLLFAGGSAPC